MNIMGYKVLNELTFYDENTWHEDSIYVMIRDCATHYCEFPTGEPDEKIGLFFNKENNIIGVVWVNDHKFEENKLSGIVNKVYKDNKITINNWNINKFINKTTKSDQIIFHWNEYLAEYLDDTYDSIYELPSFHIKYINEEEIIFTNGKSMTFDHIQDCCEYNYADFLSIDDTVLDFKLHEPLTYEMVEDYGYRFGNEGKMIGVPCYSEQNGYYSDTVDIYYDNTCMLRTDTQVELI